MDVRPANVAQVQRARSGRMVAIEADVGGVAEQLREIDENLNLRYSEAGGFFVVYHEPRPGEEYLVLTAQECDGRIVERVRQIAAPGYDYAAELEAIHDAADRQADYQLQQQVGEIAQRFAHAARRDRGLHQSTIAVPKDVS